MSEDKEISEKIEDLLFQNVNVSSQEAHNDNHQKIQKSLALENLNSLALFPRHSIEKGIPLNKNMLSEDMYPKEQSEFEQDSQEKCEVVDEKPQFEPMILEEEEEWLVDQLQLSKASRRKRAPQNTKNVLRNFGNAQNQYALYNKDAVQLIQSELSDPHPFYQWIRTLKLENFEGFKAVWMQNPQNPKLFRRVYKKVCWKFYSEAAIPYVLTSRMRDVKTKLSHLKYVFRFLEGLKNPEDFSYFKKVEK